MELDEAIGVACGALRARSRDQSLSTEVRQRAARAAGRLAAGVTFEAMLQSRAARAEAKHAEGVELTEVDVLAFALAHPEDYAVAVRARNEQVPCPADGCPGLELRDGKPAGCGHPTKTEGCEGRLP